MGREAKTEESGRYGAAPPDMLALIILVPTMHYRAQPMFDTSIANSTATVSSRWTIGTSKVRLLSFHPMFSSNPRIHNAGSENGMPRKIAPHTYRVDVEWKD
jgi:hypothetical protein